MAHTCTFIFDIKKGSYSSSATVDGGTQNETDNFGGQSFFGGVKIPVRGTPFTILRPAKRGSMWPDEKGTPEFRAYGTGGWSCKGHLSNWDPTIPPPIVKGRAAKGSKSLNFKIQLGANVIVTDVTGNSHQVATCHDQFEDTNAFAIASQKYMPEMVTAHLTVRLSRIRALDAGKEIVIDVNAHDDALALPPQNCSADTLTCSQSTSWTGTVTIRRIS